MSSIHRVIKILAICFAIFIIMNIVSAIIFAISALAGVEVLNNKIEVENFSEEYANIDSIRIETVSSNLIVKKGTRFKVEANGLKNKFSSRVTGGTLKVEENKSWFWSANTNGNITVYIPEEITKLKIDSGAGKIQIDDVIAQDFDIDQGAGSLTISGSQFEKADIDGGAGEIKVYNSELNNLKMDAGVGKIDVEASITGNSKIECGIGEMNVTLLGSRDDYRITAEKGIGSFKINNEEQKADNMTYGSGNNVIKFEGGIGAINVKYKDILVF